MPSVSKLIQRYSRRFGVNPYAVMAVAMTEGGLRWGAVGDQGTSFGPFQLHIGGALPRRYWDNPAAGAGFANSPQGIRYAIRQMANSGASGLRGRAAIKAIVRNFERPADPDASIARALDYWRDLRQDGIPGGGGGAFSPSALTPRRAARQAENVGNALQMLSGSSYGQQGMSPALAAAVQGSYAGAMKDAVGYFPNFGKVGRGELQGSDLMRAIIALAQRRGLHVGENPLVDPVDPVHAERSFHYQRFGRSNVGRAADISGPGLDRFLRTVIRRWGFSPFQEIIYDPWGQYFAGGSFVRRPYGGHATHAHFAV